MRITRLVSLTSVLAATVLTVGACGSTSSSVSSSAPAGCRAEQADAAHTLLAEGADVLSQYQDCTGTIIKAAEAAGAYSVGYHYDAASLAPKGWLTGSDWNWDPLYTSMVQNILAGKFTGGQYNTDYTIGHTSKDSPMSLAPFGPSVTSATKRLIASAQTKILAGWSPLTGPIYDQTGKLELAAGVAASADQLQNLDYLVKGVVGTLPKS